MAVVEPLKAMRIGCDSVHWAQLLTDDGVNAPTWATPVELPGVMVMNVNPNSSIETAFYDDGPGEVATTLGNIEITFTKSALGPLEKAVLLGSSYLANNLLVSGVSDTPPWGALGFRTLKSDGTYRYIWLYKGKFTIPTEDAETKADTINFQSDEITGRFVKLNYEASITPVGGTPVLKQVWRTEWDSSITTSESATITANWFNQVPAPGQSSW